MKQKQHDHHIVAAQQGRAHGKSKYSSKVVIDDSKSRNRVIQVSNFWTRKRVPQALPTLLLFFFLGLLLTDFQRTKTFSFQTDRY